MYDSDINTNLKLLETKVFSETSFYATVPQTPKIGK